MRAPRRVSAGRVAAVLVLGALAAPPPARSGPSVPLDRPLPPLDVVLRDVREDIAAASATLRSYRYLQRVTKRDRDRAGEVTKTSVRVYRVSPEPFGGFHYRLISRDGVPRSREELVSKDRRHEAEVRALRRERARESLRARARRVAKEEEARRKRRELLDEIFRLYSFRISGRATLDGHPAVRVAFAAHPEFQARTRIGRLLSRTAGQAWLSEGDHQVMRIEFEAVDDVSYGWLGALAKLFKGATAVFRQARSDGGTWLPAEYRLTARGRVMLVKRSAIDRVTEFYAYQPTDGGSLTGGAPP